MRRKSLPVLLASATVALLTSAVLAGCAPSPVPTASASGSSAPTIAPSTPAASATPTATPTPTPTASAGGASGLPANALFSISATVTAKNGAKADLVQVVYKPVAPDPADTALLNKQCNFQGSPVWQKQYSSSPVYVTSTLTATLEPGSPSFSKNDPVNFDFGWGASAYSGAFMGFEAACSPGFITIPGTVHGVTGVPSANPAKGTYGWADNDSSYGFFGGANDPGPDSSGTALVTNCVVTLSPEAIAASSKIAAWPTRAFNKANACTYGGN